MSTTMDNLEKLIQMATIEHMYAMLQKMKNDNVINKPQECNFSDEKYVYNNNALISSLLNEIKNLKTQINNINERLSRNSEDTRKLYMTVNKLETQISDTNNNTNNNSKFLCQQIRGQQVLTSYPGFLNGNKTIEEEAHIKLKIEEKNEADIESRNDDEDLNPDPTISFDKSLDQLKNTEEEAEEDVEEEDVEEDVDEEEEEEDVDEEAEEEEEEEAQEEEDYEIQLCALEEDAKDEDAEEPQIALETEKKEESEEEESEEEESEDEVGTEEETEEPKVEEKPLEKEEEEEEEEEVFEIEIDDVTYFATHEENGILYEITSDGDVGKKVGIIKDGEPIFN